MISTTSRLLINYICLQAFLNVYNRIGMIAEKVCVDCGNPLRGRSDKRFCDDACRNSYNNRLNSVSSALIRQVNGALRKNRKILEELLGGEKTVKMAKDLLLTKGLNFEYFTNQIINAKGQVYYFVYEYGYLELDQNIFLIVRHKDN